MIGMIAKANGISTENIFPNPEMIGVYFSLLAPNVWNAEAKPCHKWNESTSIAST